MRDKDGRWYSLRVRPYMTLDNKVDGAVLVLVDIDALKRSEQAARRRARVTPRTPSRPCASRCWCSIKICVSKAQIAPSTARSARRADDTIGKFVYDLGNRQWNIPRLRSLLEEVLPKRTSIEEFHVEHDFEHVGRRTMVLNARHIHDPLEKNERILLAIEDITKRRDPVRHGGRRPRALDFHIRSRRLRQLRQASLVVQSRSIEVAWGSDFVRRDRLRVVITNDERDSHEAVRSDLQHAGRARVGGCRGGGHASGKLTGTGTFVGIRASLAITTTITDGGDNAVGLENDRSGNCTGPWARCSL